MTAGIRTLIVPTYLLLCMLLGGSAQGLWTNAALQIMAALLLGWSLVEGRPQNPAGARRWPIAFAIAGLVLIVLQLVPLPPVVWTALPGRDVATSNFELLGIALPWMFWSMTPYESLSAAFTLLPPIAVLAIMLGPKTERLTFIALAVLAGALANVLMGVAQVSSGGKLDWLYLYEITNTGAVGFFANRNHMAALLLMAIPLAAAMFADGGPGSSARGRQFAMLAIGGAGFVLAIAGLLLNFSLAALALTLPVVAFSLLLLPVSGQIRPIFLVATGAILMLSFGFIGFGVLGSDLAGSTASRTEIWKVTGQAIAATFPFGSGLGSFADMYELFERTSAVDPTYVNHAHNDYLELLLEFGLAGGLLIVAFLAWWGARTVQLWRSPLSSRYAKAATIATGAVLIHSLVDFPLRTAAVATVFAAGIAIMALSDRRDSTGPRHVRIG